MRLAPPSVFASDKLLASLALEFWVNFKRDAKSVSTALPSPQHFVSQEDLES